MNNLPPDTWIRLIDWMALGLVVYFAYSYKNSNLGKTPDVEEIAARPADYKPPMAAIVGIALVVLLTIVQTVYWIDFHELLKLKKDEPIPDITIPLNLALRLFAWILTGVLVWVMMYGKGDRATARDSKTQSLGLGLSTINLIIWAGITFWYFKYIHN